MLNDCVRDRFYPLQVSVFLIMQNIYIIIKYTHTQKMFIKTIFLTEWLVVNFIIIVMCILECLENFFSQIKIT